MNCECIYYNKTATEQEIEELAKAVEKQGKYCEIYPCALSVMSKAARCCEGYDGWGRGITIPAGAKVLFVGGKLHNMEPFRVGRKTFLPWFPARDPNNVQFEDIKTY